MLFVKIVHKEGAVYTESFGLPEFMVRYKRGNVEPNFGGQRRLHGVNVVAGMVHVHYSRSTPRLVVTAVL